jgi:hypothetical protein
VDEDGDPVLGEVVADGLDEGSRESESDGAGRAEEGCSPPAGSSQRQDDGDGHGTSARCRGNAPLPRGRGGASRTRVGEDEETRESRTGGKRSEVLTRTNLETEPHGQDEDQEQQLEGQDGLDFGELPEVQCDRLEEEREDHENKPQQPDASAERMRQETQSQRGFRRRVFHPHALEDAGERIGYCSTEGTDEDHVFSSA